MVIFIIIFLTAIFHHYKHEQKKKIHLFQVTVPSWSKPGYLAAFPLRRHPSPGQLMSCIRKELELKPPTPLSSTPPSTCLITAGQQDHTIKAPNSEKWMTGTLLCEPCLEVQIPLAAYEFAFLCPPEAVGPRLSHNRGTVTECHVLDFLRSSATA